jgi:hypothetical protein
MVSAMGELVLGSEAWMVTKSSAHLKSAPRKRSARSLLVDHHNTGGDTMAVRHHEIAWTHDVERAREEAQGAGRLVLLDFSAAPM